MEGRRLPVQVSIEKVISSRGDKSNNWDKRISGIDKVLLSSGEEIDLYSEGSQSTPLPDWKIILIKEKELGIFTWTLYSLGKKR